MNLKPTYEALLARIRTLEHEAEERRRAEHTVSENQKRFQTLTNNLNVGIYRSSAEIEGRFMEANPALIQMLGYQSLDELKSIRVLDSYQDPMDRSQFRKKMMQNGYVKNEVIRLRRKDSAVIFAAISAVAVNDADGRLCYFDGIIEDISERIERESELRESEYRFRNLFDLSPQAIALLRRSTSKIVDINDKFCELFKYPRGEIVDRTPVDLKLYSEENRKKFLDCLVDKGEVHNLEMDFTARDGSSLQTLMFSKLVQIKGEQFILSIFHDLTSQKKLEAQFHQAQKLEALGTLAGGIAHDFNNLLMAIQGNVSLALIAIEKEQSLPPILKNIEKQIERGARLNKQLLGYAQKGKYEVKPIDINQLIMDTSEAFGRTKKDILIQKTLFENLSAVEADHGQMEQVLLNLFVNAADAMPNGGNLFIETGNISHEGINGKQYHPKPGPYVSIKVSDTGSGMDRKTQERIFDPFFTTKKMGRGTGLGLASVYGIIKGHNGYIDVESKKGEHATFTLYLPASNKQLQEPQESREKILKGTETVLVVDDEEIVLEVSCMLLNSLGYRTLNAESGIDAIDRFEKHKDRIDIVILDLIMPDIGGEEVFMAIKKINPSVKVMVSSGYSFDGHAKSLMEKGCNGFIQKPFKLGQLSQKIREILDSPN